MRNEIADLRLIAAWVRGFSSSAGYSESDRFRVDLAVAEAVTNIIGNAYPEGGSHEISLSAEQAPDRLSVSILDGGWPFNPLEVPQRIPPASLKEAEPGGLGLGLIRKNCDRLGYERIGGRNHLTLVFDMAREAGRAASP